MKKSTVIIISVVAVCVIAACVLFLTGVLKFPFLSEKQETEQQSAESYVRYMDSFMLISSNDDVIGSVAEQPADIPEINGISFSQIIVGQPLVPGDEKAYQYAKKIVESLKQNELSVQQIYVSADLEATLYVNQVRILLGTDNKTEEKLKELREFFDEVKDLNGTLDMQELSYNNLGYSFKKNPE